MTPDAETEQAGEELATVLEPGQLTARRQCPVARAQLSTRARAALWALRIAVVVTSVMVIYTFVAQLVS
ncbi:MAG: hypothetical protein ACLPKI_24995 [Streptosporangiaceae bacterium]